MSFSIQVMFEVFIPVSLKVTVFCDVTLCHWLSDSRCY